jgi:hypothetical protein
MNGCPVCSGTLILTGQTDDRPLDYACHTAKTSDDYGQVMAEAVMNKNNPALWGIKTFPATSGR